MSVLDNYPSTSARDAAYPAASNIGRCIFRTDTKAIEVSDGTNYVTYNYDLISYPAVSNQHAVDFPGSNEYMSIDDADIFSLGNGSGTDNAFSISAWFNADSIANFVIAAKDKSGAREWSLRMVSSGLHFFAFGTGGGYIGRSSSTTLSSGQWYHAVVTYDASKANSGIKLYINGSRVDDGDYSGGTYTAAANFTNQVWVGRAEISGIANGKIDEVAIFNTELSSSNVTAIYNSGKPATLSGYNPVGWWRMGDNDNATGTTITDQGTGSNNGTLTNGPTFHDLSTAPDSIYVA